MSHHLKLIYEFEYTLFQMTILRSRNVRGLSFFVSPTNMHTTYVRSVDLMSMAGVSDEYVDSLRSRGLQPLVDMILIQTDVMSMRDQIRQINSNTKDKSTISARFTELFGNNQMDVVAGLAIEFDKGKELVLSHGLDQETFHAMIKKGRSRPRTFVS